MSQYKFWVALNGHLHLFTNPHEDYEVEENNAEWGGLQSVTFHNDDSSAWYNRYEVRGYEGDVAVYIQTFHSLKEARKDYEEIKKSGEFSQIELDDVSNEDEPEMLEHEGGEEEEEDKKDD